MDEANIENMDIEFKRYLQIMRPYLGQLDNQDAIDICTAWVQRLSDCKDSEKALRSKYVFTLCYQLARGALEDPFLQEPPEGELSPVFESFHSDSSSEAEYSVVNPEEPKTNVLYNNSRVLATETEDCSQDNYTGNRPKANSSANSRTNLSSFTNQFKTKRSSKRPAVYCYNCPRTIRDCTDSSDDQQYESRANNLIMKLREIKKQNAMLFRELNTLKMETSTKLEDEPSPQVIKVDNTTSVFQNQSDVTIQSLKSIKCKLLEVQDVTKAHLATIAALQEQLDNCSETKAQEIANLIYKHKEELSQVKTATHDECKKIYDELLVELKHEHETKQIEIKESYKKTIQELSDTKNKIIDERELTIQQQCKVIEEKDAEIREKDLEIIRLTKEVEEHKNNLQTFMTKFMERPPDVSGDVLKDTTQQYEKRLSKMEKAKVKCAKTYEAKLAMLQRDKHLTECSLQLQLVRQRAQVVNEIADESQEELVSTLEKLESKYKEIVANVQATAIQRRVQDQKTLESILMAACGALEGPVSRVQYCARDNHAPVIMSPKDPNVYDTDVSGMLRTNMPKVSLRKSFDEDSPGYCLDSERLEELIQKVYIPQRDTGDTLGIKRSN